MSYVNDTNVEKICKTCDIDEVEVEDIQGYFISNVLRLNSFE